MLAFHKLLNLPRCLEVYEFSRQYNFMLLDSSQSSNIFLRSIPRLCNALDVSKLARQSFKVLKS
jgi:hypothetical protein